MSFEKWHLGLYARHTQLNYRFTGAAFLLSAALYILIRYNHAMEVNNREKKIIKANYQNEKAAK